ncbi:hypothetical protein F443_12530 [Plasmopara halstedii]|uniref:RxLR-like protein n=1 Tax=Plasmopara halstedii TaxID=4781 RepID=A0A0P1AXD9_PLAHL|nr:hypothetical protein F443_12530 [Plasmopara halstedii]CEG45961.1 hypothetical protein F443_12530 [Plasmopara halstedii]|eukprot:XP_024582330.1 hypothetical protein F443_12530 [Plasmopara halstedii]
MTLLRSITLPLYLVLSIWTFGITNAAFAATPTSECCSTCIGKTANAAYTYDPVIFEQCSNVSGGVCCFDCGNLGDPTYGDTVSYASDGVTAVVKAGTYISFTWTGIANVTYISLKTGQKKIATPTISNTAATVKSNTFLICAKSAGTIYFRGWGEESCREASPEYLVKVEAGDSTTCDATDVSVNSMNSEVSGSTSGSSSEQVPADSTVEKCNAQRASIQVVDGTRTCVCVSDWTNPPECNQWPVWKWIVTVGGGVAALFSIMISLNALLPALRRKKQEREDQKNLAFNTPKDDVATLEMTATSSYYGKAMMVPTTYDPQADRPSGVPRKPVENEFTL